jgi:hypothetical protein
MRYFQVDGFATPTRVPAWTRIRPNKQQPTIVAVKEAGESKAVRFGLVGGPKAVLLLPLPKGANWRPVGQPERVAAVTVAAAMTAGACSAAWAAEACFWMN